MYACPKCARSVDETRFDSGCETCPSCGASMTQNDERQWTNVARVTNLAEAGFLTDELVGLGIDARIHQMQEFSALMDSWCSLYLIRVPTASATDAAARIREYLAEDPGDYEHDAANFPLMGGNHPIEQVLWRPVALVILAGVSSFVLGQRFSEQQELGADRRPPRNELSSVMQAIDRPFVTEPADGQPAHRLRFNRQNQAWLLETDADGDGRYDSRQAYHASGASW